MDKIPYNDYDNPYWEDDEQDEIHALLEPSDFYFVIRDNPWYEGKWCITIIPKKYFDECGYWYDQDLAVGRLFNDRLPFKIGGDEETTYSPFDENITKAQAQAAFEAAGFIHEPGIWDC